MKNTATAAKNEDDSPALITDMLASAIMMPDFDAQGHPMGMSTTDLIARRKLCKRVEGVEKGSEIELSASEWVEIKTYFDRARWPVNHVVADIVADITEQLYTIVNPKSEEASA